MCEAAIFRCGTDCVHPRRKRRGQGPSLGRWAGVLTLFDRVYLHGHEYALENARVQKSCALLKLGGVDTVEAAQALRGAVVRVNRDDVALEEGTYFIADLVGLSVLEGEREIGRLQEVMTMPGQDVYVFGGAYVPDSCGTGICAGDQPAQGFIRVRLIEGMQTDAN